MLGKLVTKLMSYLRLVNQYCNYKENASDKVQHVTSIFVNHLHEIIRMRRKRWIRGEFVYEGAR